MKDSSNDQRNYFLFIMCFVLFLLSMDQCQTTQELSAIKKELNAIKYVLERKL
jgi:hypothetical protein